jgi:hypothetical protein
MEIDLHDKNVNEAINYFITKYNEILSKGFKGKITVIHGYGSSGIGGKIKKRFKEFSEAYTMYFKVSYNNNIGITIVKPLKPLPNFDFLFENELLEFCSETPKSITKIKNQFFLNHNNSEIKKTINNLIKKGILIEILKKETHYLKKGAK